MKTACETFIQVENLFRRSTTTTTATMTPPPPSQSDAAPRIAARTTGTHDDKPCNHSKVSKESRNQENHVPRSGMHGERECEKKGGGRVKKGRGGGREGKKASTRAQGHKAAATTACMSLTASASSQEDNSKDVEAHRTSVTPHRTQTAS